MQNLEEEYIDNVREEVDKKLLKEAIFKQLNTLTNRERLVLIHRFFDEMSSKSIGEKLNVKDSAITYTQAKAIRKLRHPSRAKKLFHFMKYSN